MLGKHVYYIDVYIIDTKLGKMAINIQSSPSIISGLNLEVYRKLLINNLENIFSQKQH